MSTNTTTSPPITTDTTSTTSTSSTSVSIPTTTSDTSTTTTPPTSSTTSTTSSTTSSSTTTSPTSTPTTSSTTSDSAISTVTTTNPGGSVSTQVVTVTQAPDSTSSTSSATSSSASATSTAANPSKVTTGGLTGGGKIAVAVVVPIVAVALLVLLGLFFWRKYKARKNAEELRKAEVEEYGYNPNNDPTLPAVGAAGNYEMGEEHSSGYRGWGSTAVGSSTGRKASTMSGGHSAGGIGVAYSEGTSPSQTGDTRSDNPLVHGHHEAEALGAMGPAASGNRNGDINRGPSNASSSYSAANRSDGSGEVGPGGAYYGNQYDAGNPYTDTQYGSPPGRTEMPAQPVIRDVQARRNTRIENPSHFPQQSAGISQNF